MSTKFGNSTPNKHNVFQVPFPFREDGIMVDFEVSLANKVVHVSIGRVYNRRVEVSEIADYGKLLMDIADYIPKLETELNG